MCIIHFKDKILSYSYNIHVRLDFICLSGVCNLFMNQPHKTYQNLTNSGKEKTNTDSYSMPTVTNDIFSPPPSYWLRPEVKMTIQETCEMQKKKIMSSKVQYFF